MAATIDLLVKQYVVPYRQHLTKQKEIITELNQDPNVVEIVHALLSYKGWRERAFAADVIGALKLEHFVEQIYNQALPMDEYYSAHAYAFALTIIETPQTTFYLEDLAKKAIEKTYSKTVQQHYVAGRSIRLKLPLSDETQLSIVKQLEAKIHFWRPPTI